MHFLGYVKDMTELRRKVDVEIIASKYEAYGRVTVEAMAAKTVISKVIILIQPLFRSSYLAYIL